MTGAVPPLVRLIPVYLMLLLLLATLGATNQNLLVRERTLMQQGEEARRDVASYRSQAARVDGPLAVARWAQEHGMVPVPDVDAVRHLAPLTAPTSPQTDRRPEGLEVRTIWR